MIAISNRPIILDTGAAAIQLSKGNFMIATSSFQLLEAHFPDPHESGLPRRGLSTFDSPVVLSLNTPNTTLDKEHITALIGRNGCGKTHLLSSIAKTFVELEKLKLNKSRRPGIPQLHYLSYLKNHHFCEVRHLSKRDIELLVDGRRVSPRDFPLPRRVVALTISPFDRFPVPSSHPFSVAPTKTSIYRYLGLRDRFRKSAIETLLYRSLNSLFETSEDDGYRNANIDAVFDFLGLLPTISVVYSVHASDRTMDAIKNGHDLHTPGVLSPSQAHRVQEVEKGGVTEHELRSSLIDVLKTAPSGQIETRARFGADSILDHRFRELQPLRRAGFLSLSGVEITDKSGHSSDLRNASSGQMSMITALLSLASVISDASLVLIDEPELSLHPEWQVKYFDLLLRTFARYQACHFVVATHSPLVISELPPHACVISLDDNTLKEASVLHGKSVDVLLATQFELPTNGNLYVKARIVDALRLINIGKARSLEFAEILEELTHFAKELASTDPSKVIIQNLQDVAGNAGMGGKE